MCEMQDMAKSWFADFRGLLSVYPEMRRCRRKVDRAHELTEALARSSLRDVAANVGEKKMI